MLYIFYVFCCLFNLSISKHQAWANSTVSIVFAGDISFAPPIRKGNGSACPYEDTLKHVAKYFKEVDFNLVNLESPFVSRQNEKGADREYMTPGKGVHLKAWPESVVALTTAGVKSVTLANNHISDYGNESVYYTKKILLQNNIEVVGISSGFINPYQPQIPIIKTMNGVTFGILAYCGDGGNECNKYRKGQSVGAALLEKNVVEYDVKALKQLVDVTIVYLHWGNEYYSIPSETQRRVAELLSDLGVQLIVASHPHVLQGHEWINDTLIHYSLGNFVFHPHFTYIGKVKNLAPGAKEALHKHALLQHQVGRGPPSMTELFKVFISKNGIDDAYYLPSRIHADSATGCVFPVPINGKWLRVCGEEDMNCHQPRHGDPVYP